MGFLRQFYMAGFVIFIKESFFFKKARVIFMRININNYVIEPTNIFPAWRAASIYSVSVSYDYYSCSISRSDKEKQLLSFFFDMRDFINHGA